MPETAPGPSNGPTTNASGLPAPVLGAVLADGGPQGDAIRRVLAAWGRELAQGSQRTAQTYGRAARAFLDFIDRARGPFPGGLLSATASDVLAFINLDQKAAPSTRAVKAAAVRSLFSALVRENLLPVSPALEVRVRHAKSGRHHAPIAMSEVLDVLARLGKQHDLMSVRNRALILVLLAVGARRFEIAGLNLGDFKRQANGSGLLHLTGKGSKHVDFPIRENVVEAIDAWLSAFPRGDDPATPLFCNLDRRPALKGQRISAHGVWDVVKRHFNGSPHGLRSRLLSDVYDNGDGNMSAAQHVGRHQNIGTTEGYVAVNRLQKTARLIPDYASMAEG
jgi:site-specific recombinase XerC